ncbi:34154_t:CDS:2, partial [Gigaspora margarita]
KNRNLKNEQGTVILENSQDNIYNEPDTFTTTKQDNLISEDNQNNTVDERDDLMTTSSALSHANIGQENASTLKKNKSKKKKLSSNVITALILKSIIIKILEISKIIVPVRYKFLDIPLILQRKF